MANSKNKKASLQKSTVIRVGKVKPYLSTSVLISPLRNSDEIYHGNYGKFKEKTSFHKRAREW